MNTKHITIAVAVAFLAVSALPVASAHWRGDGITAFDAPHEHSSVLHSFTWATAYSVKAQRLCLMSDLSLQWSNKDDGGCPGAVTAISPLRGLGTAFGTFCTDVDSLANVNYLKTDLRQNGLSTIVLDWGATAGGPAVDGKYNVADHFAHPLLTTQPSHPDSRPGNGPNPTGVTPNHFPVVVNRVPGVVQTNINQVGLGALGTGTSTSTLPGVDFGDNDFEFCRGLGSHTYAIDSGNAKMAIDGALGLQAVDGAGSGLNDLLGIGGDGVYDVTTKVSPLVNTGRASFLNNEFPAQPLGALISTVALDPSEPVMYSVCNSLPGAGCTNIPTSGTGPRLGLQAGENAVYSSLNHCMWIAGQDTRIHSGSGFAYGGQQSKWGSTDPVSGATGRPCWPERLVRTEAAVTSLYFPSSSFTGGHGWNPDDLPATPDSVQTISLAIDEMGTRPFHEMDSGCDAGTTVDPNDPWCGQGGPSFASPTEWAYTPNQLATFNAVFQPGAGL